MNTYEISLSTETAACWRNLAAFRSAVAQGNAEAREEWRDELEVMATHTDRPAIRKMCQDALETA